MKVSFICPARDKAKHVGKCVRSILGQTLTEMEIIISVQPSADETLAVVKDLAAGYGGPNEVRVLECPMADYHGRLGMNQHMNWLSRQITGDVVVMCSSDDWNEPTRAEKTLEAFEKHRVSWVGTGVVYETPEGVEQWRTNFPGQASRPIDMLEAVNYMVCSSASSAWSRDLWEKYGPLRGVESDDMLMPMMAFFERGVYYIDEILHHHVLHANLDNTGVEGQMRAARDAVESARLGEVNAFHNTHHWASIYKRINEMGYLPRLPHDIHGALAERVMNAAWHWVEQREALTMARIEPMGMRT